MKLDNTNLRLLELLQQDAKMTFSELARTLNRAESTIRERIMMMEQRGVIRGYRTVVDYAKVGFPVRALVELECDMQTLPALTQKLKAIPNVARAAVMTGANPVSIEVFAEDLPKLEQLIQRHFSNSGVKTSVRLVLQTLVEDRPGPSAPAQPILYESSPPARPFRYVAPERAQDSPITASEPHPRSY